jgi:hypothetical protein
MQPMKKQKIILGSLAAFFGLTFLLLVILIMSHGRDISKGKGLVAAVGQVKATSPSPADNCAVKMNAPELSQVYIDKVKKERGFIPDSHLGLTVLDDVIVKIDFTACQTELDSNPYKTFLYRIKVTNKDGTSFSALEFYQRAGDIKAYFNGYHSQITPFGGNISSGLSIDPTGDMAEKIIASVAKGGKVTVSVSDPPLPQVDEVILAQKDIPMTNCMQVYGGGAKKVVMMRGFHTVDPVGVYNVMDNVRRQGFAAIEPLKSNVGQFSFYADLKQFLESDLLSRDPRPEDVPKLMRKIASVSTCPGMSHFLLSDVPASLNQGGFTDRGANGIILDPNSSPMLFVHEFGHAFGLLSDEYQHPTIPGISLTGTNCALDPNLSYRYGGKLYGGTIPGCTVASLFRPSDTSIMSENDTKFNTVSCGYVLAKLNGKSPKENFPVCNKMNGVIHYLPQLGLYKDKLATLQASVTSVLNVIKGKRDAELNSQRGAQRLTSNPQIDGPLYLLTRMQKNLETVANSNLKTRDGFVRFFTHLRSLRQYTDPALSDVFSRASDLTGFSYLFPPSPDKPILIAAPGLGGEGGEGGWGKQALLADYTSNFNVVTYTLDATVLSDEMINTFLSKFIASGLNEQKTVIAALSLGTVYTHAAILQDIQNGGHNFSNSYVVMIGFLPGGASDFLGSVRHVVELFPYIYPISRGAVGTLNPVNPIYTNIANNMTQIANATKGISYVQANDDRHINKTVTGNLYAINRDKALQAMRDVAYVTPPEKHTDDNGQIQHNNQHVNIVFTQEVKNKIEYFRNLLLQSPVTVLPQSTIDRPTIFTWIRQGINSLGDVMSRGHIVSTAWAQAQSPESDLDAIDDFLGNPKQSVCAFSVEALRDSIEMPDMIYNTYATDISDYITRNNATCTVDTVLQDAVKDLEVLPLSENVVLSGSKILAFTLDLPGVSSVDLMVDGNVVGTGTVSPWNLSLDTTRFANGNHAVKTVLHFLSPTRAFATKATMVQFYNP